MGDGRAGLQAASHVLGQFDCVGAEIGGGLFDGNDAPHALYYACKHKVFSFLGGLYGGLNLNRYGVASPCRAVCGFAALSRFKFNPLRYMNRRPSEKRCGIFRRPHLRRRALFRFRRIEE